MADYPGDWNSRRKDVYKRDDYSCQNCGRTGGQRGNAELHAHHIVPKAKGGTHSKSNLVAVCKQCHNAIHGNSNAPTKGRSASNQSPDYFSDLSTILGNVGTYSDNLGQYMGRLRNGPDGNLRTSLEMEDTEQTLRNQILQIKTELTEFDADNAPSSTTNSFVEDVKTYSDEIYVFFESTVDLLDTVEELRQKIPTDDELSCPECNAGVEPNSSFCSSCGTELQDTDDVTKDSLSDLIDELTENVEATTAQSQIVKLTTDRINAQTGDLSPSTSTERVDWRYCPNCGFRHGVYKPDGGATAECFVCKAKWEKSGSISKWKMGTGEYSGEKKPGSEWEKLGRKKNDNEEYMQYAGEVNSMRVKRKFAK